MHAVLFSLIPTDDAEKIFAWGMEIEIQCETDSAEPTRKAVVYIDSPNGEGSIAIHESAKAACTRWSQVVPLDIVWDAELWAGANRRESTPNNP